MTESKRRLCKVEAIFKLMLICICFMPTAINKLKDDQGVATLGGVFMDKNIEPKIYAMSCISQIQQNPDKFQNMRTLMER